MRQTFSKRTDILPLHFQGKGGNIKPFLLLEKDLGVLWYTAYYCPINFNRIFKAFAG
jgi:hypothetical protein